MATRPVFAPGPPGGPMVREVAVSFAWNPGFAPVQKRKNVAALHEAAKELHFRHLLEVSTKSEDHLGQLLSAFSLRVATRSGHLVPLECVFQGSKVFTGGGPYTDLYGASPRDARRDPRLRSSGELTAFSFENHEWGLEPKTAFYDWLYVTAAYRAGPDVYEAIPQYDGFTDIEFNPEKSINSQARSCALLAALARAGLLKEATSSPETFLNVTAAQVPRVKHGQSPQQGSLF